ncbi:MAG: hypothetical protein AB1Z98_31800 [Nannocystaceae bacterium]
MSLRRLARAWPRAIVTTWLVALVVLLARVFGDPGIEISGDPDGLLPVEHRAAEGRPLLLLTATESTVGPEQPDPPDPSGGDDDGASVLQAAAATVAERLGAGRVPLGPPAAELTGWLDAHAFYLLPVAAHEALSRRLSDAAMAEAVDALKARLSSPLFGVSGEDPRRDPLRLQDLARDHSGQLTHLGDAEDMPAELTAAGDLLALDGRSLLMQLRSDEPPSAVLARVDEALLEHPVRAQLVGPGPRRERVRATLQRRAPRMLALGVAGLVLVLSLALRAIRPVLGIVLALLSTLAGMLVLGPPLDPHGLPMLVLLLGFGCEGAMHLTRISPRGWPAAAVLGTALLPLALSPYPAWQQWAVGWLVGVAVVIGLLRLLVPAVLSLLRFEPTPARRGFRLRPLRPLAATMAIAALAAGAWALPQLPFLGIDRTPVSVGEDGPDARVRESFFDPRLVATVRTQGQTPAEALERASEHARALATLVPDDAVRVDSPGRLVLPDSALRSRQRSLRELELADRMEALRELLATRGFRPDAFGEFLRGAGDLDDLPTPQAALDGPLGDWIRGYRSEDGRALLTRVHLPATDDRPPPAVEVGGTTLELVGPAVAARRDHQGFGDWLGVYVAIQLWLGALVIWLATRRLTTAIACTVAAMAAQTAVLAAMVPLDLPVGPALLPALLLVGAAAMIAGARACQAVTEQQRFYATGVLLSGLCQAVAGLTLLASGDPLWSTIGMVVAVGSLLASGAGLFIAPGMMRLLGRSPPSPPPSAKDDSA